MAPSDLRSPIVVDFPLRGEWTAVNTPAARVPSHGTDILGQRFAFDFLRLDDRNRYHPASTLRLLLSGVPTHECYAWGEPVHAPFDAEVVAAADGFPERGRVHPLLDAARAIWTAMTFRPARETLPGVLGNHVILRGEHAHAAFAHLAPGTVAVHSGQTVGRGTVIARVGHTGNSTTPHLHFQLMDGPDPLVTKGLPCAFARYELRRGDGWQTVEGGIPDRTDRVRRRS